MYGIDCAAKLTAANVQALKNQGVRAVGRYLGGNYGLTVAEVKVIHDADLLLWLIFELEGTKASYFNYDQGVSDAKLALVKAQELGVPKGVCVYFAVDFEAQLGDMAALKEYFRGIHVILTGKFLVGVYGSYKVMMALRLADYPPDRYFQTYAWSYGDKAPNHIYQYDNEVVVARIYVDRDYVNDDAGLWGPDGLYQVVKESEEEMSVKIGVLLNTKEDFWAGADVAIKNGNCALFVRGANNSVPAEATSAGTLIVVGGPKTGHPNEVFLSGNDKYDTAAAVKKYLGQ